MNSYTNSLYELFKKNRPFGCLSKHLIDRVPLNFLGIKLNKKGYNEVDETGAYYTEWSKPERKTPIQYTNAYIWNLERW